MDRNIRIVYILTFLKNSWFWLGVWVFYYLLFTNYAGIGLIETSLIVSMTVSEVPTGVVADLFGKKKTLMISFFLQSIGIYLLGFAQNLWWIVVGVAIAGVGASFYSGTLEALVYDSLKEKRKEHIYDKIIGNIGSISLIAPAICGVIGAFMYIFEPRLPAIANALCYTIGIIFCFFLVEPSIDTDKFSLNNFLKQTGQGFKELLKTSDIKKQTIFLLSIGIVVVIADEMLNGFLGFEFGFTPVQLGVVWSIFYVISALASQLTSILKRFSLIKSMEVIGILIGISLFISPVLGIILGGFSILFRLSLQTLYGNVSSILINEHTESKYRATTLSTFSLIKNIPYVLTAYFLGSLADHYSAIYLAAGLGGALLVVLILEYLVLRPKEILNKLT